MVIFITITTLLHGILFFLDEHILNKRRGLSKVEIISSLVDGILYLVLVAMTVFAPFNEFTRLLYLTLAVLSCLSIIKNEWIYPDLEKVERLVHAALYILHPLIIYAFYISWKQDFFNTQMTYWMLQLCYLILGFKAMSYHVIYWNYIYQGNNKVNN